MKLKLILITFAVLILQSFQQPKSFPFTFVAAIATNAKLISTDQLGNLFVVTQTNQLNKYGRNGKLIGTLNYSYTGNITQVDATNPMEINVFYKELNRVVFLDNNLAFRGDLDLSKAGVIQASAIARSYDNNVWVFDMGDLQLKKVKKTGEIEQTSGNIRQYIIGNASVNYLCDNNDRVFVVDSVNGVLMFDVFASYIKTIPIKGTADVKVLGNYLFYTLNRNLNRYNWSASQVSEFTLPDTVGLKKMSIEKERVYLLKPDTVAIYAY
ncbi:MAG: hypothetical protein V4658_04580 [Bacteroidota bacterium]